MAKALAPRMDAAEKDIADLKGHVSSLDERLDANVQRLDGNIAELRARLDLTATKDDIAAVNAHIDQSINGILRDALNSTPIWISIMLALVAMMATGGAFWLGLLHAPH